MEVRVFLYSAHVRLSVQTGSIWLHVPPSWMTGYSAPCVLHNYVSAQSDIIGQEWRALGHPSPSPPLPLPFPPGSAPPWGPHNREGGHSPGHSIIFGTPSISKIDHFLICKRVVDITSILAGVYWQRPNAIKSAICLLQQPPHTLG